MEINLITENLNFIVNLTAGIITVAVLAFLIYKPAQKFLDKRHQLEVDASEKIEIAKVVLDKSKEEQAQIYETTKAEIATQRKRANEDIAAFKEQQEKAILSYKEESKKIISKKQDEEIQKIEELVENKISAMLDKQIVKIAKQSLTEADIESINEELVKNL